MSRFVTAALLGVALLLATAGTSEARFYRYYGGYSYVAPSYYVTPPAYGFYGGLYGPAAVGYYGYGWPRGGGYYGAYAYPSYGYYGGGYGGYTNPAALSIPNYSSSYPASAYSYTYPSYNYPGYGYGYGYGGW